jgi:hypothetical protein
VGGVTKGRGLLYIGNRGIAGDYEYKVIEPNPTHPRGRYLGVFTPLEPDLASDFFTNAVLLLADHRVLRVLRAKLVENHYEIELAG